MANLLQLTNELIIDKKVQRKRDPLKYGSTNQILYLTNPNQSFTYYLPAYLQLTFNSISKVDYDTLKSQTHCNITFTLNVCDLQEYQINHIKQNLTFYFTNDNSIQIKTQNQDVEVFVDEDQEYLKGQKLYHYLIFTIRKEFTTGMVAYIDWTPFQVIDLILTIQPKVNKVLNFQKVKKQEIEKRRQQKLKQLKLKSEIQGFLFKGNPNQTKKNPKKSEPKELSKEVQKQINTFQTQQRFNILTKNKKKLKQINFVFNLMDCPQNKADTINFQLAQNFGIYSVATQNLRVQYTNVAFPSIIIQRADDINAQAVTQEVQKGGVDFSKIKNFKFAHFIISIYKQPSSAVATVFLPVLLLSIINLGIYFQTRQLSGRIENLATMMFAFVAIIPVIRQQIPPNPRLTHIEKVVYLLTCTTLLCLIESVLIRGEGSSQNAVQDGFFIASLIVSGLAMALIIILMMIHKFKWEPSYLGKDKRNFVSERFDHERWNNQACDEHFMKFFDTGKVAILSNQ